MAAPVTSGPMPSPGINVILCFISCTQAPRMIQEGMVRSNQGKFSKDASPTRYKVPSKAAPESLNQISAPPLRSLRLRGEAFFRELPKWVQGEDTSAPASTGCASRFGGHQGQTLDSGSDRAIPWSLVGEKPTSEGLASRRVARPWELNSNVGL